MYELTLNGKRLTSGTALDCWKFLVSVESFESVSELVELGYEIKKA